jgi:P4 family phage/plasmid primase-like protien
MRRDPIEFENVSKICLAANHKPEVRGQGYAMWRRIKLIPFNVTIPRERQDANLGEKLSQERAGILGWLVEGCLAYQREGLGEPAVIRAATAEYRDESNQLRDWLEERTEPVTGWGYSHWEKSAPDKVCQESWWCCHKKGGSGKVVRAHSAVTLNV